MKFKNLSFLLIGIFIIIGELTLNSKYKLRISLFKAYFNYLFDSISKFNFSNKVKFIKGEFSSAIINLIYNYSRNIL